MKKWSKTTRSVLSALALVAGSALMSGCTGSNTITFNNNNNGVAAQNINFVQVEELARPAIAEGLLITNDFLNGFNATLPSGEPAAAAVIGEAATTLTAFAAVSAVENTDNDVNNRVGDEAFAFIPDVMRIDTSLNGGTSPSPIGTAAYATDAAIVDNGAVVGAETIAARQAGISVLMPRNGRKIEDDTIDATLIVLTNAAVTSDGVFFISDQTSQGHHNLNGQATAGTADENEFTGGTQGSSATFPFLAGPN